MYKLSEALEIYRHSYNEHRLVHFISANTKLNETYGKLSADVSLVAAVGYVNPPSPREWSLKTNH